MTSQQRVAPYSPPADGWLDGERGRWLARKMKEGIMDVVILLLSLVAGGCGYLIVTFWMEPILRYLQIRHEVTSDLIFYANVIDPKWVNDRLKERHEAGSESHRKHAAEIAACYYRLPCWYRTILKRRGEDPITASKHLIGLSNCSSSSDADPHIQWLKKSLCIAPELDV